MRLVGARLYKYRTAFVRTVSAWARREIVHVTSVAATVVTTATATTTHRVQEPRITPAFVQRGPQHIDGYLSLSCCTRGKQKLDMRDITQMADLSLYCEFQA